MTPLKSAAALPVWPIPHRFTVDTYDRMGELSRPPSENRDDDHPAAADVYLLIEVSDSNLVGDRTTKLELYVENGIVEYWIVNLPDDCVEVYTRPAAAEPRYDSKVVYGRGQSVPLAIAGLAPANIPVDSLLPQR